MTSDRNHSADTRLLRLERRGSGDSLTLEVTGEIDMSNAAELEAAFDEALAVAGPRLIVDLAGLEFIDSSGLRSLVRLHQSEQSATAVVYRNAHGQVAEVLEITGLRSVLELDDQ